MTSNELKALRRFFFLDVKEAAQYIGDCSPRAWQRWEDGTRSIPDDVVKIIEQLKLERKEILNKPQCDLKPSGLLYDRLFESVQAELLAKKHDIV